MFDRASKLRFRRKVRMRQHQVTSFGKNTEEQLDEYFISRLDRLVPVRRFVVSWILLVSILILAVAAQTLSLNNLFQRYQPVAGGTYIEGIVGEFTNANPLYATSNVDSTVSRLLFASLLTYDKENQLVGDLAESWDVDDRGQVYTVTLRENLRWHDEKPLTSDDVVFTYKTIQNADAGSPLRSGWRGVQVEALDERTIRFTLPTPLASFAHGMTNGVIPKHILETVAPVDMRSVNFNTNSPVGSGPFQWRGLEVDGADLRTRQIQIALVGSDNYHRVQPKLERFNIHVFRTPEQMIESFNAKELTAMAGLTTAPSDVSPHSTLYFTQTAASMVFFKTTEGVLADKAVRQALTKGTDTSMVRKQLTYPAKVVDGPLLRGQIGYDEELKQFETNKAAAEKQLTDAGWIVNEETQVRAKGEQPLEFTLYAENSSETGKVTRELRRQWQEIGVNATVVLQDPREFQITLSQHGYDALLRGISIGLDPDVFPFWHSSQAEVGLNFSEYSSSVADEGLEAARTRTGVELRTEKYKPFLQAWREDAPAIGLYQPQSLYVTRIPVFGLEAHDINTSTDRFANVEEWMVRRAKTTVDSP